MPETKRENHRSRAHRRVQTRFTINRKKLDMIVRRARRTKVKTGELIERYALHGLECPLENLSEETARWLEQRADAEGISLGEALENCVNSTRRRISQARRGR